MDPVTPPPFRQTSGVALFEALLALAVFGLVAVGLVESLQQLGLLTVDTRIESHARRNMAVIVEEKLRTDDLRAGAAKIGPDDFGVLYTSDVFPHPLTNQQGDKLDELFRIIVTAEWGNENLTVETLRYAPLYQ